MKLTDTWGLLLLSTLLVANLVKAENPVRLNQCHGTDFNCANKSGTLMHNLQAFYNTWELIFSWLVIFPKPNLGYQKLQRLTRTYGSRD